MFAVTPEGTFEHGRSVLQLLTDPADDGEWRAARERLLAIRSGRIPPARDDKVVAAWNGLAIAALADCGVLFDRPDLLTAATACASLLADIHVVEGRLRRVSRDGVAGSPVGVLEDYGDVTEGLLALHQATGELRWLELSGVLLDAAVKHFDDGNGGFFDTADDAEQLVRRPQDPTDNATPAGMSAAAGALVTYAALTGSSRHREAAERALGTVAPLAAQHARFVGWSAAVGEALLAGPLEVAVVGDTDGRRDVERAARLSTSPGAVVVVGEVGSPASPLLADRPLVDGRPAVYVCQGFVCDRPLTGVDEIRRRLGVAVG